MYRVNESDARELLELWETLDENEKDRLYWMCRIRKEGAWWLLGCADLALLFLLLSMGRQPRGVLALCALLLVVGVVEIGRFAVKNFN